MESQPTKNQEGDVEATAVGEAADQRQNYESGLGEEVKAKVQLQKVASGSDSRIENSQNTVNEMSANKFENTNDADKTIILESIDQRIFQEAYSKDDIIQPKNYPADPQQQAQSQFAPIQPENMMVPQ